MSQYAARTTVSVEKSRNEIEQTLARYGAKQFMYGWSGKGAIVAFVVRLESGQDRQVRFELPLPSRDDREFQYHSRGKRTPAQAEALWEQACRQKWRALALVVKSKLEAISSGIATFEDEFLAYTMLPSGETVSQWLTPQMEAAYDPDKGIMPTSLRLALPSGDDS